MKGAIKFKHAQYVAGECTHEQYYGQFVTAIVQEMIARRIGVRRIIHSTDLNFNDIPLVRWEIVALAFRNHVRPLLEQAGDGVSLIRLVRIAKAAARMIKETREVDHAP